MYQYTNNVSPQPNWRETGGDIESDVITNHHHFEPTGIVYPASTSRYNRSRGRYEVVTTQPSQAPTSIIIDLSKVYLVNNIVLELERSGSPYTIQVSRDNRTWRQLIDYSMMCSCRQVLWFPKQAVRYHITVLSYFSNAVLIFHFFVFLMQVYAVCSIS